MEFVELGFVMNNFFQNEIIILHYRFFVGAYAQISNELDVDDIKKQIGDHIPDVDLSGFDQSKIPQADEIDLIFRNKCDSKSGNGTYDNIQVRRTYKR